jgi:hypothetical protein
MDYIICFPSLTLYQIRITRSFVYPAPLSYSHPGAIVIDGRAHRWKTEADAVAGGYGDRDGSIMSEALMLEEKGLWLAEGAEEKRHVEIP